ncbi:dephospho-CoA kinase, partial [Candidatus Fermentibacteria bacterium]|nr:dephospho-CoA kinase [Candidatus Fermentibacteria bacterium]
RPGTAARALEACGFEILSLDDAGHRLLERDHIRRAIADGMGDPSLALLDGGSMRAALRRSAFDTPEVMAIVERVLHPRMSRWMSLCGHIIRARRGKAVIEGALFFELGGAGIVDGVIVMASDERDSIARIMARDGLDERSAARRLSLQMPLTERLEKADWVILNSAGTSEASVGLQALAIAACSGLLG